MKLVETVLPSDEVVRRAHPWRSPGHIQQEEDPEDTRGIKYSIWPGNENVEDVTGEKKKIA